ncbi:MAG: ATP synthase F1 subunit delta [Lachnospira sp.]
MAKLVETTYGDALFDLALQESKMDVLCEEAQTVIEAFKDNAELGKLLSHPKIVKEEKQNVVKNVFSKFVSDDMTGLLVIMVSKDRQNNIVSTLEYFIDKVYEYKKIGIAYVSTAKPLTEAQKAAVVNKLLATTDYVQFKMNYLVDESLIAGMVIRIGDRIVDSSIKHKIDELAKDLKKIQLVNS